MMAIVLKSYAVNSNKCIKQSNYNWMSVERNQTKRNVKWNETKSQMTKLQNGQ